MTLKEYEEEIGDLQIDIDNLRAEMEFFLNQPEYEDDDENDESYPLDFGKDGSCCEPSQKEEKEFNSVSCPKHYTSGKIEVIDYIEDVCGQLKDGFEGFLVGNVIKYISRQDKKNGVEDVKKLVWYSERLIKYKGGKND